MVEKTALNNPTAPDFSAIFSRRLKLRDVKEVFIVSGRPAWGADWKVLYPNDGVAQTKYVLDDLDRFIRPSLMSWRSG